MAKRSTALFGGWLAALGLATGAGWAGVSLVGDEVSPSESSSLSQAEVAHRIQIASSATPSPSNSSSPSVNLPATAALSPEVRTVQRSFTVHGGTVVLACSGGALTAKSSPRLGYAATSNPGGQAGQGRQNNLGDLVVVFDDGHHRSQVDGSCNHGAPEAVIHETGIEGDD